MILTDQLGGNMKSLKKIFLFSLTLPFFFTLAACNKNTAEKKNKTYAPQKLTVQFVPSQNATTIEAKAKPLEKLLENELNIPVKVNVSTDYNTIVEALGSKKVDVAFLPPDAYVLAHKHYEAKALLLAQRYDVTGADDHDSNKLVDFYRSQILVRKDSGIAELKDLKNKRIAVQDTTSTSGWIFPAVGMYKKGIDINKENIKTAQIKGHDQGVLSVYNKDTDAAFVWQGARNLVKNDAPDIMDQVIPIYTSAKIPNDTITVRGDLNDKWQKKISQAFKKVAQTKKRHAIVADVYGHEGYTTAKDSDFDVIREYNKTARKIDE